MAQPAPVLEWFLLQSVAHGAEQLLKHRKRELHTCLTIRRCRHLALGEMTQVCARRIPMQNLDKKHLDGLAAAAVSKPTVA